MSFPFHPPDPFHSDPQILPPMKLRLFSPILALVTLSPALFAASTPLGQFPATGNGLDLPVAVAVDASGGIVVTGTGYVAGQAANYVTVKYSGAAPPWSRTYNGAANSYDEPKAIAVDAAGNIHVTGSSRGARDADFATVKYDPDGQELWTARYDSGETDVATAVGIGPDGSVYVAGSSDREGGLSEGYVLVKYSIAGAQLSVTPLGAGSGHAFDLSPTALAVDAAGNVLVAGAAAGVQEHFDTLVLKLDAAGQEIAHARFSGPGLYQVFPAAVAFGPDGSFVVAATGGAEGVAGPDLFVAKFDAAGQPLWSSRYGNLGDGADKAVGLFVGPQGNILVLGSTRHGDAGGLAVLKLNPQGTRLGLTEETLGSAVAFSSRSSFGSGEIITATLRPDTIATFRTPTTSPTGLPQITSAPEGYTLIPGVDRPLAVLAANATGYQWFRDGMAIAGATTTTVSPGGQPGDYAVQVSNAAGAVLSSVARVSTGDVLYSAAIRADGSFRSLFSGESGRIYELQSSNDLNLWNTFATGRYTGTPLEITDPSAAGIPYRFYRARRCL